jgi:uncharacterized membrane protein
MRREVWREYVAGSLWVVPGLCGLVAMAVGALLARVDAGPGTVLAPLAFQGTADDARSLLAGISATVVTVIALVLGLTVVALQLSSTQFSPRLLRNFLRDRPNQVVLGVFVATFSYATAGLFTVGLAAGGRSEDYPRLAVSGALALLFASLAMVVYFADHLTHSIQIDSIMKRVERSVLRVVGHEPADDVEAGLPDVPTWARPVHARRSGYLQTIHPEALLPMVARDGLQVAFRRLVGDHVVAGTVLAWVWTADPDRTPPDPLQIADQVRGAVRIGFERTFEQDIGFGLRQLVDIACKALSPGINDPYTAVQSIDHLSVIFCLLADRPLGSHVLRAGPGSVAVPARSFGEHLAIMCGLIRRYGCREPTVLMALLRLLDACAEVLPDDPARRTAIRREATLIRQDAEREVSQPADARVVREAVTRLGRQLDGPARP